MLLARIKIKSSHSNLISSLSNAEAEAAESSTTPTHLPPTVKHIQYSRFHLIAIQIAVPFIKRTIKSSFAICDTLMNIQALFRAFPRFEREREREKGECWGQII